MKKINFVVVCLLCAIFTSCGVSKKYLKNGWVTQFSEAQKYAKSCHKDVFVFISSMNDYEQAEAGVGLLVDSPDFPNKINDKYVCMFFDFRNLQEVMAPIGENLTGKEQKAKENAKKLMMNNLNWADRLALMETPMACIVTSNGDYITAVDFDYLDTSVDGYVSCVAELDDEINSFNDVLVNCKKGKSADKLSYINKLYDITDPERRMLFVEYWKKGLALDATNEKFIIEVANGDALVAVRKTDFEGAAKVYQDAAENENLSASGKQQMYFCAANVLTAIYDKKADDILDLLKKSIEADPDSMYVSSIQDFVDKIEAYILSLADSSDNGDSK